VEGTRHDVLIAGRYELGPLLRRGGMADVHDGVDRRLQRAVAIKVLRPDMAARRDVCLRFEAEAKAAARLAHPNVVAVFDTGDHDGLPYIVMERLPGRTLADVIAEGPVDPAWLLPVAADILAGLGAAHAAGIVHRDVKPANVLLTAEGTAKLTDFGIAKSAELADGSALDLTGTGQLIGTPAYLAPERLAGAPATFLSDLYSMGVLVYEALAGTKPFAGTSFAEVARAVAEGAHEPLGVRCPNIDPQAADAVERALATDPTERFESAEAMAAALVGPPATVTLPTAALAGAAATAPTEDLTRPLLAPAATPGGRPPRLAVRVALAAVVACVLIAAAAFALTRHPATRPAVGQSTTTSAAPPTTLAPPAAVSPPAQRAPAPAPAPAAHGRGHKGRHGG
jgi:serine/threonine protein kinase